MEDSVAILKAELTRLVKRLQKGGERQKGGAKEADSRGEVRGCLKSNLSKKSTNKLPSFLFELLCQSVGLKRRAWEVRVLFEHIPSTTSTRHSDGDVKQAMDIQG